MVRVKLDTDPLSKISDSSLVDEKNMVERRDSTTLLKMTNQIIRRRLIIDKDDEYIYFAPITYIVTKRKVIKIL